MIPVYNEERQIAECLNSVKGQSRPFDEVVIVDNGCTDDTMSTVENYMGELPIVVIAERTPGVRAARATGFDTASGDVIARIDADTRLDPAWSGRLRDLLEREPEVSAVAGANYVYGVPESMSARDEVARLAEESLGAGTIEVTHLSGNNMAIRKEAWLAARPRLLNASGTHEDLDLYCVLTKQGERVRAYPALLAGVSSRRLEAPIRQNFKYLAAVGRTYRAHREWGGYRRWLLSVPGNAVNILASRMVLGVRRRAGDGRISPIDPSRE